MSAIGSVPRPSVLALRALGLGDFLAGVPAYRALRRAFPAHEVVLAAPRVLAPLVPLTGAIDALVPVGELRPVPWRGAPPDVGVDLHGCGPASHDLVAALSPRRLVVFGGAGGGGYPGPRWRADEHERVRWCRLLAESGIPADPHDLILATPNHPLPRALVGASVVHPGAASPARRWPPERFAALVRVLADDGHRVVVTGGADDDARVALVAGAVGTVAGRTDLARLAALIAAARVVVSGDTGVAHLAAAFARPSVTLFGPTPPAHWGPPADPRHRVLWPASAEYRGDPHGRTVDPVLAAIEVEEVARAVRRALAGPPASPSVPCRSSDTGGRRALS
ncbi:hypothetical protein B4N89_00885 [Embleya scabrispora]|uniref:Glycosyl transferase n=1 Tax=Embleya scabrispora TaxID=159449 RepID=A0A1T3NSM7_9ACTN|nr:glycosyltransferase family 9 protein [Embleya scabrispora]OPC79690.1 hypothetical protein B4N89_00885 [Embleya scabrispora]